MVVHGDDFVALGTDDALSMNKDCGNPLKWGECVRLGLGDNHVREHRILNRAVKIAEMGPAGKQVPGTSNS